MEITPLFVLLECATLALGAICGYYARQSIAKKRIGTAERELEEKSKKAKQEAEKIYLQAKERAEEIIESAKKDILKERQELRASEHLLFKRENFLNQKIKEVENREKDLEAKIQKVRIIKEEAEKLAKEHLKKMEEISGLKKEDAKKELLNQVEKEFALELYEKTRRMKEEGEEELNKKAKEILATAIQRCAISQAQELTTSSIQLLSDEIKGKIIGKEGRNIRTFEKITGVEVMVDETDVVTISSFDPVRREIAKLTLEKLIKDGRIQPVRIEEKFEEAKQDINKEIKEAGEKVCYELGLVGIDSKLMQLLGKLKFRTSYGQNVLLHSYEVAILAEGIASELGANAQICKKAGLFHDIGKALDQEVEGSHVEIGIKILEKFNIGKEIITAMKSHHEDYPYENIEAIIVQVADQISGGRPGARKDTIENYLKRLKELEDIALQFQGVEKSWALQAGRELWVFVKPEEVDDLSTYKMARDISKRIKEELRYPGTIKVVVSRETKAVEYAR